MVGLNDLLAGAAPGTGHAINSRAVGAARSAAPTLISDTSDLGGNVRILGQIETPVRVDLRN